ncbi:N-acetylmuramoyl-L-alanine amidase [Frisingicoccus sp.]|uniref:N-acetylmuramoyl-L-alanine amidase family protein n=1 Tax=Frisingicoccus sp. TaxID=1918627 RepID=UPI00386EE740
MAKIYLVAGHGGSDPGACGLGRKEKDDTLRLTLDVGAVLANLGHTVKYNRTSDKDTDMYAYIRECNAFGADFCLSIHRNSFNGTANGYETCIYQNSGKTKVFADSMNAGMAALGFTNRGSKIRTELAVLNSTTMEAALIEVGFIDNQEDNQLFVSRYGDIVKLISESVLKAVGVAANVSINTSPAPEPKPSADKKDLGNVDVIYQAFTDRWWPKVKNREDWAGKGDGYPILYLAICVSKGSIKGRVYTEKNGWLPDLTFKDKYDINDLENGVLGDGSPIQAIELYYNTPDGYEYKKVAYCVSGINRETFYPVQHDNETGKGYDGYAGVKGVAVDKFQAWIE